MTFRFFLDENKAQRLGGSNFQAGVNNVDIVSQQPETILQLPWCVDPRVSYLFYECTIGIHLDAGMVLHKPLPQQTGAADTLASTFVSPLSSDLSSTIKGANFVSVDKFQDVAQKMATSDYRFVLFGRGARFGYKVPIPGLKMVAGCEAFPDQMQRVVGPRLVGNYSNIPLWYAEWELWYFIISPPSEDQQAPPKVDQFIAETTPVPGFIQPPYSLPDPNSVAAAPPNPGFITVQR